MKRFSIQNLKSEEVVEQEIVTVDLGRRAYEIRIASGLRRRVGTLLRESLGDFARTVVVVSNPTVWKLYGADIEASLSQAGIRFMTFLMGDGERFKTLRTAGDLWSFLIENRVERKSTILAVGGGVVGDMAGFAAATYLRGIPHVQVPTTLLAQIDSSVGGKTAVNHPGGKNLIGAFHQPSLVLADLDTSATLPRREWVAGWCEALKYGVIRDESFFAELEHRVPSASEPGAAAVEFLRRSVARCCRIKAGIVAADELETGERRILNFGHTFGHALEAATGYRMFRHGEAVGYGMIAAAETSVALGLSSPEVAARLRAAVHRIGKLPRADRLDPAFVLGYMQNDKKNVGGKIRLILPTRIGEVVERDAPPDETLRAAFQKALIFDRDVVKRSRTRDNAASPRH